MKTRAGLAPMVTVMVLAAAAAVAAPTQVVDRALVRPGDDRVDGSDLQPFVATYQVWVEEGGERTPAQTWTRSLMLVRVGGAEAIDETWRLHFATSTVYDQSIYARATFEPVMKRILSWRGNDIIDFTGPRPRYTYIPLIGAEDPATSREIEIDGKRFAGGGNFALAMMGLHPGDEVVLASVGTDPGLVGALAENRSRVSGRERIESGSGEVFDTLRVEGDNGAAFWLSSDPPYVVRRRFGNRVWELVEFVLLPPAW